MAAVIALDAEKIMEVYVLVMGLRELIWLILIPRDRS